MNGETCILVFGTFDILHPGHEWFLRTARKKGDRLTAVVSRDDFVHSWKGRSPLHPQGERMKRLEDSGLVDTVVSADPEIHTYKAIRDLKPDIICLGHDQNALKDDLNMWLDDQEKDFPRPRLITLPAWRRKLHSTTNHHRKVY